MQDLTMTDQKCRFCQWLASHCKHSPANFESRPWLPWRRCGQSKLRMTSRAQAARQTGLRHLMTYAHLQYSTQRNEEQRSYFDVGQHFLSYVGLNTVSTHACEHSEVKTPTFWRRLAPSVSGLAFSVYPKVLLVATPTITTNKLNIFISALHIVAIFQFIA